MNIKVIKLDVDSYDTLTMGKWWINNKTQNNLTQNDIVNICIKNEETISCMDVRFSNEKYIIIIGSAYLFRIYKFKLNRRQKALFK